MKIFLINKFLYPKGGDAVCTLVTAELLRAKGHETVLWGMNHPANPQYPYGQLFVDNLDLINAAGINQKLDIVFKLIYSKEAKKKVEQLIKTAGKPDVVHLHNFAHQISPSILDVFKKYKIPCVMTMHDYKLVCASYTLLSKDKLCEKCTNRKYYNCFLEGCVKDSKAKSLLNTFEMYLHHKLVHIYKYVDTFISPSIFLKNKIEKMGFTGRIVYIPNFIDVSQYIAQYEQKEKTLVYFGRLSKEKGVTTLIDAVMGLDVKLKVIGEGPAKEMLVRKAQITKSDNIEFLGYKTGEELKNEIRNAMAVVVPSEWYENNPRSIIEAFALGKLVVGARIGGIPELVKDNETGLTFESGNTEDLRSKIEYLVNNPNKIAEMGRNARSFVEEELNAELHYQKLMAIYNQALNRHK